jgi:hypothetical protein
MKMIWIGSLQKMRQNYWKKSAKTHNSSLVVHQLPVRGGVGSSQGKNNIFLLGLPLSQDENAGGLELAGHLENKIPLNLNAPLNLNVPQNFILGTRDHCHNSLQI